MTNTPSRFRKADEAEFCPSPQTGTYSLLSVWCHAWHDESIAGNAPSSFDHEKQKLECYRNSDSQPDQHHPRHRPGNNFPVHPNLEFSANRQIGETNPIWNFFKCIYLNNMQLFFERHRVKNEPKTNPNKPKTNPILRQITPF